MLNQVETRSSSRQVEYLKTERGYVRVALLTIHTEDLLYCLEVIRVKKGSLVFSSLN